MPIRDPFADLPFEDPFADLPISDPFADLPMSDPFTGLPRLSDAASGIRPQELLEPQPQGLLERLLIAPGKRALATAPQVLSDAAFYLARLYPTVAMNPKAADYLQQKIVDPALAPLQEIAGAVDVERGHNIFERAAQAAVESSPQMAATIASGPAAPITAFALAGSQSEQEALSRGLSPGASRLKGIVSGALTAPLEVLGAGAVRNLLRNVPTSSAAALAKRLLAEPATELTQEATELLLEAATGKKFASGEVRERLSIAPLAAVATTGAAGAAGAGASALAGRGVRANSEAGAIELEGAQEVAANLSSKAQRLLTTRRGLPEDVFQAQERQGHEILAEKLVSRQTADRLEAVRNQLSQGDEAQKSQITDAYHRYLSDSEYRATEGQSLPEPLREIAQASRDHIDDMSRRLLAADDQARSTGLRLLTDEQRATIEGVAELQVGDEYLPPSLLRAMAPEQTLLRARSTPEGLAAGALPSERIPVDFRVRQIPGRETRLVPARAARPPALDVQTVTALEQQAPPWLVSQEAPDLTMASELPSAVPPRAQLPGPPSPELVASQDQPALLPPPRQRGLGEYLRRSYAFHDGAKAQFVRLGGKTNGQIWTMPKASPVWQAAREWIREQPDFKDQSDGAIEVHLTDFFRSADAEERGDTKGAAAATVIGTIDRSSLKHRQDLDVRLRNLLGEHKGDLAYLNTIESMSRALARGKMYVGLLQGGMGRLFLEDVPTGEAAGGFINLKNRAEQSIAANEILGIFAGRPALGPAEPFAGGRRVQERNAPDLFIQATLLEAFDQGLSNPNWLKTAAEHSLAVKPMWWAAKAAGAAKASLTVYLPRTQLRNFFSNPMALIAGGNLFVNPRQTLRAMKQGFKTSIGKAKIGTRRGANLDQQLVADIKAGVGLGVFSGNVDAGDLDFYLGDTVQRFSNGTERLARKLEGGKGGDLLAALVRAPSKMLDLGPRLYQLGDDVWKATAFSQELYQLRQNRPDLDPQDPRLYREAAEIVKQTMQNYERLAVLVQELRAFPLLGPFVSFPAASMINLKNQVKRSFQEIGLHKPDDGSILLEGAFRNATTDTKARAQVLRGMRRLGGVTAATTVGPAALSTIFKGLAAVMAPVLDLDPEPDDGDEQADTDRRLTLPSWNRFSRLMYLGKSKSEPGVEYSIDTTFIDYFGAVSKPIMAAIHAGKFDENPWKEALKEIASPYLDSDVFFGALGEAIYNKDQYGREIYNPESPLLKKAQELGLHMLLGAVGPADAVWRMYHGISGEPDFRGREYSAWTEMFAQFAGPRILRIDFDRAVRQKANHANAILDRINQDIRDELIVPRPVKVEEAQHTARVHRDAIVRVLNEAKMGFEAAQRRGVSRDRAIGTFADSNLPKALVGPIIAGQDPQDIATAWLRSRYALVQKHRTERLQESIMDYRRRALTPEALRLKTEELRKAWAPLDLSWM